MNRLSRIKVKLAYARVSSGRDVSTGKVAMGPKTENSVPFWVRYPVDQAPLPAGSTPEWLSHDTHGKTGRHALWQPTFIEALRALLPRHNPTAGTTQHTGNHPKHL